MTFRPHVGSGKENVSNRRGLASSLTYFE